MAQINQGPAVAWPRANLTNRVLIIPLTYATLTLSTSNLAMHEFKCLPLLIFDIFIANCISNFI